MEETMKDKLILMLPDNLPGLAELHINNRFIGRIWMDGDFDLSIYPSGWMLTNKKHDYFIHPDAIRKL